MNLQSLSFVTISAKRLTNVYELEVVKMTALREEALKIVNELPDYLMDALVYNLKYFKSRQFDELDNEKINNGELDQKKAAAFAAMEEWIECNRKVLSEIDSEKERELAMEEKYGPFN